MHNEHYAYYTRSIKQRKQKPTNFMIKIADLRKTYANLVKTPHFWHSFTENLCEWLKINLFFDGFYSFLCIKERSNQHYTSQNHFHFASPII